MVDRRKNMLANSSAKLIACLLIVLCLVLGAIGILVPFIPGLIFLGFAALLICRHFPSMERVLRKSPAFDRYLDSTDGMLDLPVWSKVQLAGLFGLKIFLKGAAVAIEASGKVLRFAVGKYRESR